VLKKGFLTFIQDYTEGVVSVIDFGCCDDRVIDQTQNQGGGSCGYSVWQNKGSVDALGVLSLARKSLNTKQFSIQPLLAPLTNGHFCVTTICTKNFCTLQNTVISTFSDFVFIFLV
jgi:hypothetical protein